jgi:hypothetical protein
MAFALSYCAAAGPRRTQPRSGLFTIGGSLSCAGLFLSRVFWCKRTRLWHIFPAPQNAGIHPHHFGMESGTAHESRRKVKYYG